MQYSTVNNFMTPNPRTVPAHTTLAEAAQVMRDMNCGILPVGSADNLQGVITDRDIVTRAVSYGADITRATVSEFMSCDLHFIDEHKTLADAASLMYDYNVWRLLVTGEGGRLTGVITFGAIMRRDNNLRELSNVVELAKGRRAA